MVELRSPKPLMGVRFPPTPYYPENLFKHDDVYTIMEKEDGSLDLLIENSVALQKVLTDVASSLNQLTKELRQLLELFKEAGKTLAEDKASQAVAQEEKKAIIDKLDTLADQNRTIARGLVLLESSIKEKDRPKEYRF